jgi:hypothetical protein
MAYKLLIKFKNNTPHFVKQYYNEIAEYTQQEITNSKEYLDLICPSDNKIQYGETSRIDFEIECILTNNQGIRIPINLQPNIGKDYPIQMIDGIKTFFRTFSGNIFTDIRYSILTNNEIISYILSGQINDFKNLEYNLKKNHKIFRLISPDYSPMKIFIVNDF